jgi:ketosteroid isomerase-like protein
MGGILARMSQANVEVVRAAQEAMAAGNVEAALACLAPDVEWHGTVGGLDEGSVYHGHEAVVQGFLAYFEMWERIELRAERYIDTPGDEVVVFFHEVARGRQSGALVETDTGTVNTVRDGTIVRVRAYMEREEALRVAGLTPNVEIVRAAYEAMGRGDFDLAAGVWDPDGEWVPAMAGITEGRLYRGPAGVRRYFDELLETFPELRIEDLELSEHGDRVLVLYRLRVRGRASGVPIDQPAGAVYELRGDRVVRGRSYLTREEALAAVQE